MLSARTILCCSAGISEDLKCSRLWAIIQVQWMRLCKAASHSVIEVTSELKKELILWKAERHSNPCTLKWNGYNGFRRGNRVQHHRITGSSTSGCCVKSLVNRALWSLLQRKWMHTIKGHFRKSTLLLPASMGLAFGLTWKQGVQALAGSVHLAHSGQDLDCSCPNTNGEHIHWKQPELGNWREGCSITWTFQEHRVPSHQIINYPTPASRGKLTNCISSDLLFHKKIIVPPGDADIAVSACSLHNYKGSTEKHF